MDAQSHQQIKPVTPAMMMNINRMGSASVPVSPAIVPQDVVGKGKGRDDDAVSVARTRSTKRGTGNGLKTLLPAGPTPHILQSPTTSSSGSASVMTPQLAPQVRKSSHKAAEQKRRDSLKTTFDDLRGLLPPIPLSNSDNPDDPSSTPVALLPSRPLLPGALPPRGPPKAGGEGPNKGVSKLQLLMCGNEYIRVLRARVERRDTEIAKLRREVARLRDHHQQMGLSFDVGVEDVDLEKDIDAVELIGKGGLNVQVDATNGDSVEDDDEDG